MIYEAFGIHLFKAAQRCPIRPANLRDSEIASSGLGSQGSHPTPVTKEYLGSIPERDQRIVGEIPDPSFGPAKLIRELHHG